MQEMYKKALVAGMLVLLSAGAQASPALAKKKGCASCHGGVTGVQVRAPIAGMPKAPTFYELYSRFGGQPDAEANMAAALLANKTHPKMAITEMERKALIRFYVSTEPVDSTGQRQVAAKVNEQAK